MAAPPYLKLGATRTGPFRDHLASLGVEIPFDDSVARDSSSPLAAPLPLGAWTAGNRFAVHPMEGWDGTTTGLPTDRTRRRWIRFGESGAKLIWGCEAAAVRPDGRANPNQLMLHSDAHQSALAALREALVDAHRRECGTDDDLVVGLQLTHSGRFCRPRDKRRLEPMVLYRHPILDRKFGLPPDHPILTDGEIRGLIDDFARAAVRAHAAGFQFVDLKQCHGYLGHEFLSAVTREGEFGGPLENRARFLGEIVRGIRARAPGLGIGVRLSAFDLVPFRPDPERSEPGRPGPGIPEEFAHCLPYVHGFGADAARPTEVDLTETFELCALFEAWGITMVNVTAGSPYYNPHIQRPALYPPSDGYAPPEDPLVGVARQMRAARAIKARFPRLTVVGTAYTYLQEFLPNVAQAAVRLGWVDAIGLGRMVLAYPWLPSDLLGGREVRRKLICRTFSDCTTAPRNGLVSGCYPLDPYYKSSPDAETLAVAKREGRP